MLQARCNHTDRRRDRAKSCRAALWCAQDSPTGRGAAEQLFDGRSAMSRHAIIDCRWAASLACVLTALPAHAALNVLDEPEPLGLFAVGGVQADYLDVAGGPLTGGYISMHLFERSPALNTSDAFDTQHFVPLGQSFREENTVGCKSTSSLICSELDAQARAFVAAGNGAVRASAKVESPLGLPGTQAAMAQAAAVFGTQIHLVRGAVVHASLQLDGSLGAPVAGAVSHMVTALDFFNDVAQRDGTNQWRGNILGGYTVGLTADTTEDDSHEAIVDYNFQRDFDVKLPVGTSFLMGSLDLLASVGGGNAVADFSHTLRITLSAPPAAGFSIEVDFVTTSVPLPPAWLLAAPPLGWLSLRARRAACYRAS